MSRRSKDYSPWEEIAMADTTVTKVDSEFSPRGAMGQKYLASGVHIAMRLWEDEPPGEPKAATQRAYESVGYVIKGSAELEIEGQIVRLGPGNSWVVPKGAMHRYTILEPFTAVEATYPPAHVHGRDET
jgi:quercetin dioxygenase-like cupin family protein